MIQWMTLYLEVPQIQQLNCQRHPTENTIERDRKESRKVNMHPF